MLSSLEFLQALITRVQIIMQLKSISSLEVIGAITKTAIYELPESVERFYNANDCLIYNVLVCEQETMGITSF